MAALQSMEEYGVPFQMKVISSLLNHKEFLQNIHDVLTEEHFSNPAHLIYLKRVTTSQSNT